MAPAADPRGGVSLDAHRIYLQGSAAHTTCAVVSQVRNPSTTWPESRTEIPFGRVTLTARVDDQVPERRKIIFDPVPKVDGIEPSGDPITDVRSDVYLMSGRRRRAVFGDGGR